MGQNDKGSIFGGLTQMVVPAPAPTTTPPPAPASFEHLGSIQVAPPTGASKAPDSPSLGQKVSQVAEDIIPLSHEAKTLQNQISTTKVGQQADQLVHQTLNEHPEQLAMGGEFGEGAASALGEIPGAIEGAAKDVGNTVIDALAHPTHAPAPMEGNPEAGVVRVHPIDADVRDASLKNVQDKVQAKQAVQQADRDAAENLANKPKGQVRIGSKPYDEQKYQTSVPVKVSWEDGLTHTDEVKGMNEGHAMARAKANWPDAKVERYVPPQREPNYAYRSRDIGEHGIPANEESHAQLTSSEDQARLYTQPGQRDSVTGKPQELVRVDLNKLRPSDYSTKKTDEGVNWHKLHRDVGEELVEKMPVDYFAAGKQAGVEFRGIQKGIEGKHPGVAMFQDPQSGTSVAVRLDEWSPAKLQEHLDAARERMKGTPNTVKTVSNVAEPKPLAKSPLK